MSKLFGSSVIGKRVMSAIKEKIEVAEENYSNHVQQVEAQHEEDQRLLAEQHARERGRLVENFEIKKEKKAQELVEGILGKVF